MLCHGGQNKDRGCPAHPLPEIIVPIDILIDRLGKCPPVGSGAQLIGLSCLVMLVNGLGWEGVRWGFLRGLSWVSCYLVSSLMVWTVGIEGRLGKFAGNTTLGGVADAPKHGAGIWGDLEGWSVISRVGSTGLGAESCTGVE